MPITLWESWDSVGMSMGVIGGEIAPRLQMTVIIGSENHRMIHDGPLSFFPAGTQNGREQIFDTTFIKLRNDKVTDKDFSNMYRFTFQSNGGIGSGLNLGEENQ